jgi:hypothetical protein
VYVPEILPLHVRAKGTAVGVSSNWLWNFFVVMVTPTLIENLAWKGYLIFMALNFVFIPVIYFLYPETSNLTLEKIDWLFLEPNVVKKSIQVSKYGWGANEGLEGGQQSSDAVDVSKDNMAKTSQVENTSPEKTEGSD